MATSCPASSATAAASGGSVTTVVTETLAGTRVVMTVDGYSKIKEALFDAGSQSIKSETFRAGGHSWYIEYQPWDDEYEDDDWVMFHLLIDDPGDDDEVTARYELALLNRDGREIIASTRSFYTFSRSGKHFMIGEKNTAPLLGDSFQVMCDLTIIEKAAVAVPRPDLHHYLGGLLASQLGGDVTFQVGGELFTAHKCILAARSTVFKDELFGPGKENCAAATPIRIDGMEPRVFRALLHFIYTDALPEMEGDGDKVTMAQGLLVAAHRYGMETLKSICGDMLYNHIDARTAMGLLQLAYRHGCRRLEEACTRATKDMLAKVATP